jgi:hypothetical protein
LRRSKKFPVEGILWLLEPDTDEWHLVIATPRVDTIGPRDSYRELAELTRDVSADSAQLLKIELVSPNQAFYKALRTVFGHTASVEGARLGNTNVAGTYIDGAYLYEVH